MFKKILLAVDGSEHARRAIPVAVELARLAGGEVFVVHIHEKEPVSRESYDVETRSAAAMLVEAAYELVVKSGAAARSQLRVAAADQVARELLLAADEYGANAIVVGSRGLGAFAELLLGSVAHKVVQLAKCPVVVVR